MAHTGSDYNARALTRYRAQWVACWAPKLPAARADLKQSRPRSFYVIRGHEIRERKWARKWVSELLSVLWTVVSWTQVIISWNLRTISFLSFLACLRFQSRQLRFISFVEILYSKLYCPYLFTLIESLRNRIEQFHFFFFLFLNFVSKRLMFNSR